MANPIIPPLQHPHPNGFVLNSSIPNNNRSNPLSDQHPPPLSVAVPHHRQSSRSNSNNNTSSTAANATGTRQSSSSSSKDPYYGHEDTAKTCSRAIKHIFGCLDEVGVPTAPTQHMPTEKSIPLAKFIAYAFHRTRLPPAVAFHALVLLTRLKMRYPNASCAHGHRLFLTSYMLSSKVICDDTYSNKSWAIVGQGFYELRDVNLMEREMISFLAWDITISGPDLEAFMVAVKANYRRPVSKNTVFVTVPEVKKLPGSEYFGRGTIVVEEKKVVPLPEVEELVPVALAPLVPTAPRMPMVIVPPTHNYSSPPPLYSPADDGTPSPSSDSGSSGPPSPDGVITPTDDGVSLPNALPVPKHHHHHHHPHHLHHNGGVQVHDGGDENSWGWAGRTAW